jgi:hypothetical protein
MWVGWWWTVGVADDDEVGNSFGHEFDSGISEED